MEKIEANIELSQSYDYLLNGFLVFLKEKLFSTQNL